MCFINSICMLTALTKPTPMLDFKRKLLQQSQKSSSPSQRISAVELLKATKPPPSSGNNNNSPPSENQSTSTTTTTATPEGSSRRSHRVSYISNRLTNRRWCNSPRTDVLSATIVEGRSEEELADSRPQDPSARRHLNFSSSPKRRTPSSGSSTPIETSL